MPKTKAYIYNAKYRDNVFYSGNRIKALERDLHSCKDCGSKKNLTVHHIDKTGQYKNPNNNMDNLITLCRKCHRKHHTTGGIVICNCIYCGKEYEADRHDVVNGKNRYCSRECCDKDKIGKKKTAFISNCNQCGKEFKTTPYRVSICKGKYCSSECSQESQRKRIFVRCMYCDKELETIEAKLKQGRGRFCSRKCSGIFSRKKQLSMGKG